MNQKGQQQLDQAFDVLEGEVPDRIARAIRWLRSPRSRKVRLPLGVLFIVGGLLWFLPVVGIELLPIGLLLVAQDVPFLKEPVARALLWLERKWLERKWLERKWLERKWLERKWLQRKWPARQRRKSSAHGAPQARGRSAL